MQLHFTILLCCILLLNKCSLVEHLSKTKKTYRPQCLNDSVDQSKEGQHWITSDSTNLISPRFESHTSLIETQHITITIPLLVVSSPAEVQRQHEIKLCFTLKYLTLWQVKSTLTAHRWRFLVAALCEAPHTPGRSRCAGPGSGGPWARPDPWPQVPGRVWTCSPAESPPARLQGPHVRSARTAAAGSSYARPEANSHPGAQVNSLWEDVVAGRTSSPFEPENKLFRNNETDSSHVWIQRCEFNLCAKLEYRIKKCAN